MIIRDVKKSSSLDLLNCFNMFCVFLCFPLGDVWSRSRQCATFAEGFCAASPRSAEGAARGIRYHSVVRQIHRLHMMTIYHTISI